MKSSRHLILTLVVSSCTPGTFAYGAVTPADVTRTVNVALSRPAPADIDALLGGQLLRDGGTVEQPELGIARAILRTNQRITPAYALLLAITTTRAARGARLQPEFLAATLLQESAYDPAALSSAGAIGIAQFMPETAAGMGIDPYDPFAAVAAAAALLGGYVAAYSATYADPYAAALAAYNAGPEAVRRYGGVPPYAETREYVALVYERMLRIAAYETPDLRASYRARRPAPHPS